MLTRKPLLLSALLVMIVALFIASDVRGASQCTTSDNKYVITFNGVFTSSSCSGHIYRYTLAGDTTASFLELALARGLSATSSTSNKFLCPPAAPSGSGGEGSFKYAASIPQVCVITFPDISGKNTVVDLCVNGAGGSVDLIGVHTQTGDSHGICMVDGPTQGLPASMYGAPNLVYDVPKQIKVGACVYSIDIDQRTGCPPPGAVPRRVSGPLPPTCPDLLNPDNTFTIGNPTAGSHSLKFVQGTGDISFCPIGKIVGGSPDCQWIYIGGTPYGPVCF
jgi:hypothetical protein